MVRFIDEPSLRHISNTMSHLDCGDQKLDTRFELYVYDGVLATSREENRSKPIGSPARSPLGSPVYLPSPLKKYSTAGVPPLPNGGSIGAGHAAASHHQKDIYSVLVYILNDTYPDYQFNRLARDHFIQRSDIPSVVNSVNQTLSCVVERSHPGILDEMWQILRQNIDLVNCDVYELDDDALDESRLWSFYLFWHDKLSNKVLLVSCRSKSKFFHNSSSSSESGSRGWSVSSSKGGGIDDLGASSSEYGMSD